MTALSKARSRQRTVSHNCSVSPSANSSDQPPKFLRRHTACKGRRSPITRICSPYGRNHPSMDIKLFTIGFTHKSAREFFTALKEAGVQRVVDVRLNNNSQLAGFSKKDDLRY